MKELCAIKFFNANKLWFSLTACNWPDISLWNIIYLKRAKRKADFCFSK